MAARAWLSRPIHFLPGTETRADDYKPLKVDPPKAGENIERFAIKLTGEQMNDELYTAFVAPVKRLTKEQQNAARPCPNPAVLPYTSAPMPANTYPVLDADSLQSRLLRVIHEDERDRHLAFKQQMLALSNEGHIYEFNIITEMKFFLSRAKVNDKWEYTYTAHCLMTVIMSAVAYNELLGLITEIIGHDRTPIVRALASSEAYRQQGPFPSIAAVSTLIPMSTLEAQICFMGLFKRENNTINFKMADYQEILDPFV